MKPNQLWRGFRFGLAALLGVVAAQIALADPPGRVARLSEFAGDVRIASAYEDWQPAFRNQVITASDNVWVSEGGRAELDVGGLQVWLSGGANVYFDRFDDHSLVARLASGSAAVRIRYWEAQDAMRITTEHGEMIFTQPGLYFLTAGERLSPSVASVRFGQAELIVNGRNQWLSRDQTMAFDLNGARIDRFAYAGAGYGGFEAWVTSRDRRIERWESRNRGYVNPWMVGIRELDEYGSWETTYEYGRVWYPRNVSYDWAPYRYGRWSWVSPWGWTWVDDAPWGFAPSHYGRWVRVGGRWAWYPGQYVGRPVYAPALVTFFGGNGWSINASIGPTYSWVPLGRNEPYAPWYSYSRDYWRGVNRPYVRNSAEDPWRPPAYVHANVANAVTSIAANRFIPGRAVAQEFIRPGVASDLRGAPPARMAEVMPQFSRVRAADPNPVVQPGIGVDRGRVDVRGSAPSSIPEAINQPRVSEGAVTRNVPPQAIIRERAVQPVAPTPNVLEPRVWQDPNPVVAPRQSVRESAPTGRDYDDRRERVAPPVRERQLPDNGNVIRQEPRRSDSGRSAPVVRDPAQPSAPSPQSNNNVVRETAVANEARRERVEARNRERVERREAQVERREAQSERAHDAHDARGARDKVRELGPKGPAVKADREPSPS